MSREIAPGPRLCRQISVVFLSKHRSLTYTLIGIIRQSPTKSYQREVVTPDSDSGTCSTYVLVPGYRLCGPVIAATHDAFRSRTPL